ncbi:MAG: hypothetical protein LBU11_08175 [Zoogloeaceae bacterium]|jgi:hypothetical protein|nr:hypothetical protein [Zoogloeaceae bacterium]
MSQSSSFKDLNVAIIPHPALGDTLIGLRLGWIFRYAGSRVHLYSSSMYSAREYFPWLDTLPDENLNLLDLSPMYDLVIGHVRILPRPGELAARYLQLDNIAYLKSKNSKDGFELGKRSTFVRGRSYPGASRVICLDSKAGLSMVQWIDQYAHEVFGLDCPDPVPVHGISNQEPPSAKAVIFPTSALAKKNYSLRGWLWLANRLTKNGWLVDFVCLPKEQIDIQNACANFAVRSFPDIKELMDYLLDCAVVISNDSGGGHLASLMGKKTFTITRRKEDFSWRPGFNELNCVLAPLIGLRLFGCRVWRPFVPIWRIPARLGKAPDKSSAH